MDAKISYAQSSDIKSRSFREYRHDMKKKAIAELEFLPFLQHLLAPANVQKFGADKDLWFLQRQGRITQEPDYIGIWPDGSQMLYEFQYAEDTDRLQYFDFKLSKVGSKKPRQQRVHHDDRQFFYVVKPTGQYALVTPDWIMKNSKVGAVPAWGNREAFRVPVENFRPMLQDGGNRMRDAISAIDDKNLLLQYQKGFLAQSAAAFSRELQHAVDRKKIVKIVPTTLDGFFRICFILERIDEKPDSPGVWLVYLMSFFKPGILPEEMAHWMFAFDFLYFRSEELSDNEKRVVGKALDDAWEEIAHWDIRDGFFARDPNMSPAEETTAILHAANLLEDIQQDFAVRCSHARKVSRIFEVLPDFAATADCIRRCQPVE